MGIFRQLHKSTFWSQLLLGMLAILSLPETQAVTPPAQPNTIQQSYYLGEVAATQQRERQHIHFLTQCQQNPISFGVRTEIFCRFCEKSTPLQSTTPPPIRAGPTF